MAGNRTVEVELSTTGLDAQGRPQRIPLVVNDTGGGLELAAPPSMEPELESDHMLINIGPQHPATHGVLRLVLELEEPESWSSYVRDWHHKHRCGGSLVLLTEGPSAKHPEANHRIEIIEL